MLVLFLFILLFFGRIIMNVLSIKLKKDIIVVEKIISFIIYLLMFYLFIYYFDVLKEIYIFLKSCY